MLHLHLDYDYPITFNKKTAHNKKYSASRSFFFTEKELVNLKISEIKKM